MNLFGIGGVGLMQFVTGRIYDVSSDAGASAAYQSIFLFYGLLICAGLVIYIFSADRTD